MLKIILILCGVIIVSAGLWSLIPTPGLLLQYPALFTIICGISITIWKLRNLKNERMHILAFLSLILGMIAFFVFSFSVVSAMVLIWFFCGLSSIIIGSIFLKLNNTKNGILRGTNAALLGMLLSAVCFGALFNAYFFYNPQARYDKAISYYNKGDYDRAIIEYNKLLKIVPEFVDAYEGRGLAYYRKGDYERAISDYNYKISKLGDQDYYRSLLGSVYYNRALAYFSIQRYDKSLDDVHKAENFGYKKFDPKFLEDLKKALGKER